MRRSGSTSLSSLTVSPPFRQRLLRAVRFGRRVFTWLNFCLPITRSTAVLGDHLRLGLIRPPADIRSSLGLRSQGLSLVQIASQLVLPYSSVRRLCRRHRDDPARPLNPDYSRCGRRHTAATEALFQAACALKRNHPTWGAGIIRVGRPGPNRRGRVAIRGPGAEPGGNPGPGSEPETRPTTEVIDGPNFSAR